MSEYIEIGESIECEKALINARKFTNGALVYDDDIGRCIRYVCSRNGNAITQKELNPKVALKKETSHLDLGDSIRAERFYILVKGIRRLRINKVGGFTGRHSTGRMVTSSYTFAEISKPFQNIINSIENRTENE